jgi:hypothetical protein
MLLLTRFATRRFAQGLVRFPRPTRGANLANPGQRQHILPCSFLFNPSFGWPKVQVCCNSWWNRGAIRHHQGIELIVISRTVGLPDVAYCLGSGRDDDFPSRS